LDNCCNPITRFDYCSTGKSYSIPQGHDSASFVDNIPALQKRFSEFMPVSLYGEMDGKARDVAVSAFKRDPKVRLLVANPAAAREGLTLTQARTAIYVDRTFNLVDFLQSQDRIHRLSQTKPCEIVLLTGRGTIDIH
jgi:SWI/SNF-related matrix-associated actin-dependent regulator 1 of chromatin subfamily A